MDVAGLVYYLDVFILDEADRLLDMGFSPDIFKIIKFLPRQTRQTVFCSATLKPEVKEIASKVLKEDHEFVTTIKAGEASTHLKVSQFYLETTFGNQLLVTISLLLKERCQKAIIFLPTAHLANLYYNVVSSQTDFSCHVQHSRQSQQKRQKVSNEFRDCESGLLFATDVVARGLDFPNVTHVIQVGLPDSRETYIHRIGRTGRAGADGTAYMILAQQELAVLNRLKGIQIQPMKLDLAPEATKIQQNGVQAYKKEVKSMSLVYQSWLGYYRTEYRTLNLDFEGLVHEANVFASLVLDCDDPPALEQRVVNKMGLKGVKGILISRK